MARIDRTKFNKELQALIDSYTLEFQTRAKEYSVFFLEALNSGKTIQQSIKYAEGKTNFNVTLNTLLIEHMMQATAAGYGIKVDAIAKPKAIRKIYLDKTWSHDKMKLSERLHGRSIQMRTDIIDTVSSAMRLAKSFVQMARDLFQGYNKGQVINQAQLPKYLKNLANAAFKLSAGDVLAYKEFSQALRVANSQISRLAANGAPTRALKTAYSEFVRAAETLSAKAIEKAANTAIQEKSRYYAERISRTEIARAFAESVFARCNDDPDVVGYKWCIGTRHPRFDICDFHANVDLFGMGAGIYPKSSFPVMPSHPHCHCYPREVLIGEGKADNGKFNKNAADKYLKNLSPAELKNLMGVGGSDLYRRGGNWENLLRNYEGHTGSMTRIKPEMVEGDDNR